MFEDNGDDGQYRPLPDPSTRAWRHPSELSTGPAAQAAQVRHSRSSPTFKTTLFWPSAVVGTSILLAAAALVVIGGGIDVPVAVDERAQAGSGMPTTLLSSSDEVSHALPEADTSPVNGLDVGEQLAVATAASDRGRLLTDTDNGLERLRGEVTLAAGWDGAWPLYKSAHPESVQVATLTFVDTPELVAVTSRTALDGASVVYAASPGGWRQFDLIAVDHASDLAVLQSDAEGSMSAEPNSTTQSAVVIDYAFEVCAAHLAADPNHDNDDGCGIVSNTSLATSTLDGVRLYDLYHTTIPFHPGLAGAPLLGPDGELVGMVVQVDTFLAAAMPIAAVRDTARQLFESGVVARGWLGIETVDAEPSGATVTMIVADGPAVDVLDVGDRIVSVDGAPILDALHLGAMVQGSTPGDELEVSAERASSAVTLTLTAGQLPQDPPG